MRRSSVLHAAVAIAAMSSGLGAVVPVTRRDNGYAWPVASPRYRKRNTNAISFEHKVDNGRRKEKARRKARAAQRRMTK